MIIYFLWKSFLYTTQKMNAMKYISFFVWHNINERITIICIFCCLFICSHKYLLNDSKHNRINVSTSKERTASNKTSDVLFDILCSCILFALFCACVNEHLIYIPFCVYLCSKTTDHLFNIVYQFPIICLNDEFTMLLFVTLSLSHRYYKTNYTILDNYNSFEIFYTISSMNSGVYMP